jgi:hypothetical protein
MTHIVRMAGGLGSSSVLFTITVRALVDEIHVQNFSKHILLDYVILVSFK